MALPRNPQFNVRIPPKLKEEIVALAEMNKRPVNAEIVDALENVVEKYKALNSESEIRKAPLIMVEGSNEFLEFRRLLSDILKKVDVLLERTDNECSGEKVNNDAPDPNSCNANI